MNMKALAMIPMLALAVACEDEPGKGKAQAEVAEAVQAPSESEEPAQAVQYEFSQAGSTLGFVGAKVTDSHEGKFETFKGTIRLPGDDIEKGKVTAEIQMASVDIEPAKLEGHLKSGDFFDVEKHPTARFESTSIKRSADGTYKVTGNLELRGTKKSITFPARIAANGDTVDVDAEFAINRKDFGIVYPGMPDDLIKDQVLLQLALKANKSDLAAR